MCISVVMMAGKSYTSAANQTMKFVYSEAVNRALRQRCRGLAAAATTTTDDDDLGDPPLPPELLLAALQSGDLDLSIIAGKTASSRLQNSVVSILLYTFLFSIRTHIGLTFYFFQLVLLLDC